MLYVLRIKFINIIIGIEGIMNLDISRKGYKVFKIKAPLIKYIMNILIPQKLGTINGIKCILYYSIFIT